MNELSKHIEYLLLSHDCVVLPQFGAFVTQQIESTYEEDESLLLPPQRSVRFNQDINADDGLLCGSLQTIYHCSETEAKRKALTLVLQLRQQLLADGQADFGSLGQFIQDEDGVTTFEACNVGAPTPDFYGLDAIVFPRLQTAAKTKSTRRLGEHGSKMSQLSFNTSGGDIDIHIGRRFLRNVGVAAALIALFFLLPTHLDMTRLTGGQASIIPTTRSHKTTAVVAVEQETPAADDVHSTDAINTTEAAQVQETAQMDKGVEAKAQTRESLATTAEPRLTYAVVLASAIPINKAESYAAQLTQRGLAGVHVMQHGKMVRVVMDGFLNEPRAREQLNELRDMSDEFATAWIMKVEP